MNSYTSFVNTSSQIGKQSKTTYEDYKKIKGFNDVGFFLQNYVNEGGEVTKNVTCNNMIDVTDISAALSDNTLARAGTSFTTSIPNTTYYLDFHEDGDWRWGTAHPQGVYLPIAEVTTDQYGNALTITDKRGKVGGFRLKDEFGLDDYAKANDLGSRGVNIKYPPKPLVGAKGDGVTDDTEAIRQIAIWARDNNVDVFIPHGHYYVTRDIIFYTSVNCQGTLITPNEGNSTLIGIARTKEPHTIRGMDLDLANLRKGSTKIPQLAGMKGATIHFYSNETLIYSNPSGIRYLKRESSAVNDDHGQITPALGHEYTDRGSLELVVYPKEDRIIIDGLKIRTIGDKEGSRTLVDCVRSDVVIRNLSVDNSSQIAKINQAVRVVRSCNVVIENLDVRGLEDMGDNYGYGINIFESSSVTVQNGYINDCRHAISGRFGKSVKIIGGSFSQEIETHWGMDWLIDGATIIANRSPISFVGADLTVVNCSVYGNYSVAVRIRSDTPELAGILYVKGNKFFSDESRPFLRVAGFDVATTTFDHGKVVENPSFVVIEDNYIDIPNSNNVYLLYAGSNRNYSQTTWGHIYIGRNKIKNNNKLCAFYGFTSQDTFVNNLGKPIKIIINDQDFINGSVIDDYPTMRILDRSLNSGVTNGALRFEIDIDSCSNVQIRANASTLASVEVKNSSVTHYDNGSGYASPREGIVSFIGCLLDNTNFTVNLPPIIFRNNIMRGELGGSSGSGYAANTILSMGNVAEVGATNLPPLDDFKDSNYFQ